MLKTTAYQYELSLAWWYDSKNSKQINLSLKASIAYNLNVASSFHLLLLQQTICEFLADEGFVNGEALKSKKGMLLLRVVPMLKTYIVHSGG